jgi:hypothetical protein
MHRLDRFLAAVSPEEANDALSRVNSCDELPEVNRVL